MSDLRSGFRYFASPQDDDVYLTEVIPNKDDRAYSKAMTEAKRHQIKNLLDRGTFKVILREEIPKHANVLPGRFVLALKSTKDGEIKDKTR